MSESTSIVDHIEKCIKRYDYLINKKGSSKELTNDEEGELLLLTPNVSTSLVMMLELFRDAIEDEKKSNYKNQHGGAGEPPVASAPPLEEEPPSQPQSQLDAILSTVSGATPQEKIESIRALMAPIIAELAVFIEKNEAPPPKTEDSGEPKKYNDIGTATLNTLLLLLNKIKGLFSSDSIDKNILDQIDPPTMIPGWDQLDEHEAKEITTKITESATGHLEKMKKTIAGDISAISTESVEAIMNGISLIPGIGTTLQIWRLLQNGVVLMSKTVNSAAAAKKAGTQFKKDLHEIAKKPEDAAAAAGAPPPAKEKTPEEAAEEARLAKLREENTAEHYPYPQSQCGGGKSPSKTKLWTTKKYKKEYEKSVRELKRTRKRFMNYMKRKIV
jgi:hypothetical protein